jgi:hypothetical protein
MRPRPAAVIFLSSKLGSVHPGESPMMWNHICVTAAVVLAVTVAVLMTVAPVTAPVARQGAPKLAPAQVTLDSLPDRITVCRDAIKSLGRRAAIDRFPVCDRFVFVD